MSIDGPPRRKVELTRANHVGNISGNLFNLIVEIVENLVVLRSLVVEVLRKVTASFLLEPRISVRNITNYISVS
jgi:hypothetical protein